MKRLFVISGIVGSLASLGWAAEVRSDFESGDIARANGGAARERLCAAIQELGQMFGARYPAAELLAKVDAKDVRDDLAALEALAREALIVRNPLMTDDPILFVTRKQYRPDHHNTETMFQTCELNTDNYDTQGSLKLLDAKSGSVRDLFTPGTKATVRDPDIRFDAKKILFSMRRGKADDYHLYVLNADGTGLRQLTSAPGVTDIDPIWLPDGGILFSATREPKYCMCNRHIMCNLYRMESDGANVTRSASPRSSRATPR